MHWRTPVSATLVSGKLNTDVTNFVACPHCGARAGKVCRTRTNWRQSTPHEERVSEYMLEFPERNHLYKGGRPNAATVREINNKLVENSKR
jgi:hypothetical protein